MPGAVTAVSTDAATSTFSTTVGLLYVFNLIVGTGALALPRAFQTAGYLLGTILLMISASASYICATFVIECLAVANFVLKSRRYGVTVPIEANDPVSLTTTTARHESNNDDINLRFKITQRIELTEMAHIFLGSVGVTFTYVVLSVYLFGDLAIYSTTVPKSLMNVICVSQNVTTVEESHKMLCQPDIALPGFFTRLFVYRLCVLAFAAFCAPMVLVGMTRTKYVQLATTISRWIAFFLMIVLASSQLIQKGVQAHPPAANLHGFGSFFGVSVYAFMCHHSIPGLVTPMRNPNNVSYRIGIIYVLIFVFYATLSLTGSFAFAVVQDVYTLNFLHDDRTGNLFYFLVDYFLALFPVFTLTSSYIIVAITLCNNLRVLYSMCISNKRGSQTVTSSNVFHQTTLQQSTNDENEALLVNEREDSDNELPSANHYELAASLHWRKKLRDAALPVAVVGLPTLLSIYTDNVLLLASVNGSYPGVGVQFIIPSALALGARAYMRSMQCNSTNELLQDENENDPTAVPRELASPFHHWLWPYVTLTWAVFCVIFVSFNIFHLG